MYKIYLENQNEADVILYDGTETDIATKLQTPTLKLSANAAGSLQFGIYQANKSYDNISPMKSTLVAKRDEDEIWWGRPLDMSENFNNIRTIYCEGALAFLNDTIQPPYKFQGSINDFLRRLLNVHNANVDNSRKIQLGSVTVVDSNDYILRYTNYETTLECITGKLVDQFGGYIRVVRRNGIYYLDYLDISPKTSSQTIEFGKNLLDYTRDFEWGNLATVVIPRGAMLNESPIPSLYAYLTVESVNNGSIYVESPETIAKYGRLEKVIDWQDITDPSDLLAKAQQYLASEQFNTMSISINALDQHLIAANIESFDLLDMVHVLSEPHGVDNYFIVSEMNIPLDDPANTEYVMGGDVAYNNAYFSKNMVETNQAFANKFGSLPTQQEIVEDANGNATYIAGTLIAENNVDINNQIANTATDTLNAANNHANQAAGTAETNAKNYTDQKISAIPSQADTLAKAKAEATALINAAGIEGYVTLVKDSSGRVIELLITNLPDYTKATKVWRWNLNGFGYSNSGYAGPYVSAMTMDGAIVADRITTGTMSADRVRGGTIEGTEISLGGGGSGALKIYTSNNKLIGKWDESGVSMYGKTDSSSPVFQITADGQVIMTNAAINGGMFKGILSYLGGDGKSGLLQILGADNKKRSIAHISGFFSKYIASLKDQNTIQYVDASGSSDPQGSPIEITGPYTYLTWDGLVICPTRSLPNQPVANSGTDCAYYTKNAIQFVGSFLIKGNYLYPNTYYSITPSEGYEHNIFGSVQILPGPKNEGDGAYDLDFKVGSVAYGMFHFNPKMGQMFILGPNSKNGEFRLNVDNRWIYIANPSSYWSNVFNGRLSIVSTDDNDSSSSRLFIRNSDGTKGIYIDRNASINAYNQNQIIFNANGVTPYIINKEPDEYKNDMYYGLKIHEHGGKGGRVYLVNEANTAAMDLTYAGNVFIYTNTNPHFAVYINGTLYYNASTNQNKPYRHGFTGALYVKAETDSYSLIDLRSTDQNSYCKLDQYGAIYVYDVVSGHNPTFGVHISNEQKASWYYAIHPKDEYANIFNHGVNANGHMKVSGDLTVAGIFNTGESYIGATWAQINGSVYGVYQFQVRRTMYDSTKRISFVMPNDTYGQIEVDDQWQIAFTNIADNPNWVAWYPSCAVQIKNRLLCLAQARVQYCLSIFSSTAGPATDSDQNQKNSVRLLYANENNTPTLYFQRGTESWAMGRQCRVVVDGDFTVLGTKNRMVETENYGHRLLNSVESPECHFTDYGSDKVGKDGTVEIHIDPVFMETCDMSKPYQVFLTRTSKEATEWVEKKETSFIVHGELNATFDWQVVMKQKGFSDVRLEEHIPAVIDDMIVEEPNETE